MRSGSPYGSGRSSTAWTTLKIAVLAPMPSASARTTTATKPGLRAHAADGVLEVLPQLRQVLARADGERGRRRARIQTPVRASRAVGVAVLLAEHLLHLAAVVGAEVERQQAQQAAKQSAVRSYESGSGNEALGARHAERRLHPPRLGVRDLAAELGQPVVPPPLVVQRRVGPLGRLGDDAVAARSGG